MSVSVRAQGSPLWWPVVLLLIHLPSLSATCPSFCICDQIKLAVSCVRRNLTEVPTTIPEDVSLTALDKAPKLVLLDLSFNQLRVLQPLSGPEKLKQVNLTGNPIQCNCYMRPFREWTGRARVRAEVFCAGPVPFRGERLDSLRPVDLRCQSQAEMEKAEREDRLLLLPALEPTAEPRGHRGKCPEHCDCKADIQHSSCEGKGLQKIPKGFPADTKLLDMRSNRFHYIPGKAFSDMGEVVSLHLQK
ncbi:UNVERIFIED_CONTAM: hypothetical protein FKN15_019170 [Acipenser sinensis]